MKIFKSIFVLGLALSAPVLASNEMPVGQEFSTEAYDELGIPDYSDGESALDIHQGEEGAAAGHDYSFPDGDPAERYKDWILMPIAHASKAALSLPAGVIGGIKGTDHHHKYRVFTGAFYGLVDTVDGCVKTALLPVTMPYYLYKALKKKAVKDVSKKSVFSSYFRAKNGFRSVYKKSKKTTHA